MSSEDRGKTKAHPVTGGVHQMLPANVSCRELVVISPVLGSPKFSKFTDAALVTLASVLAKY